MKNQRDKRKGSVIVEGTLCLAVALTVLIGIIDAGQILFRQQALVERVRAGCRYAITRAYNADQIRNVVVYGKAFPAVPAGSPGLMGLTPSMVVVNRISPGSESADRISVRIQNYPVYSFTPGISKSYTSRPIAQTITVESMGNNF